MITDGFQIPSCWSSVQDFVSEMNRIKDAGIIMDEQLILRVMRVIYDRAENDPAFAVDMDMSGCMSEIIRLEKVVAHQKEVSK